MCCVFIRFLLLLTSFFSVSSCDRRIINGSEVTVDKRYMVYLSKTINSARIAPWICGGSIISDWFVLTSAACVEDEKYVYVVWGYRDYVTPTDLDKHECTRNCKRVVTTFVPEEYQLSYNKADEWAKLDIAVVKVEIPFDRPSPGCMYRPEKIQINFDAEYEKDGVDVIILGWGHSIKWVEGNDINDYNQKTLHSASTKIFNKEQCKKYYTKPDLGEHIDKYMICTYSNNNKSHRKSNSNSSDTLESFTQVNENINNNKKRYSKSNYNEKYSLDKLNTTRRQGICQNDHGGPLVTKINGDDVVIGVASMFRVNNRSECEPPFLYTSTARNQMFIECILAEEDVGRRSNSLCDLPARERGFNIIRKNFEWPEHLHSVTENVIYRRPQIAMNKYGRK